MNNMRKRLLLAAIPLTIFFGLILWYLPRIGASLGIPQGSCSVKSLLLDINMFPSGTTISPSENLEGLASDATSLTFRNQADSFDADHRVEYYNTPLLAWQAYKYNYRIFTEDKYSGTWTTPTETTFSSQIANQYHFACANDVVLGYQCILTARYGRYFVFFRSAVTKEFAVENIGSLLQEIDTRMSPCVSK